MNFKIWCLQRGQYFAEGEEFETLKEVEEQLKSYHENDVEGIHKNTLAEILEYYEWEVHDKDGNIIEV